jgi:hypothetical protein
MQQHPIKEQKNMSARKCNCTPRHIQSNRVVCRTQSGRAPCNANAATLAKTVSKGQVGLKGFDQACPQRSDIRPNETAADRNRLRPILNPHVRHASAFWPKDRERPARSETSLNNVAVKRVFFPKPPPAADAPRTLPDLYWQAPQLILPDGVRCSNFTQVCAIPREHQMRLLAEEVAKMRDNGIDIPCNCAPVLDASLCH